MKLALAALLAALVAAPAAHAGAKLRVGAEAVLGSHDKNTGWTSLTDRFLVSPNLMVGFTTPLDILSIDLEVSEQFLTNPGPGENSRQGTTLRPGITLSAPVIPIYARAAIPLHIEPSPFQSYARVGVGLAFNFVADHQAIVATGATPVLCDVDDATLGLDPDKAAALVGPRTKALLPLHFGGLPGRIQRLQDEMKK